MAGFVFGGVHILFARPAGGFTLLGFAWIALFGSLGWMFLDFGLAPPWGGRVWAWVIVGVVFWLMVVPVALDMIGRFVPGMGRLRYFGPPVLPTRDGRSPNGSRAYQLAHLAALPGGIVLGVAIYRAVAGG